MKRLGVFFSGEWINKSKYLKLVTPFLLIFSLFVSVWIVSRPTDLSTRAALAGKYNPKFDVTLYNNPPKINSGTSTTLVVSSTAYAKSKVVIGFDVPTGDQKTTAVLRLKLVKSDLATVNVYELGGSVKETDNNLKVIDSYPVKLIGTIDNTKKSVDGYVELDVSEVVQKNDAFRVIFLLETLSNGSATYSSRETKTAPQLVLTKQPNATVQLGVRGVTIAQGDRFHIPLYITEPGTSAHRVTRFVDHFNINTNAFTYMSYAGTKNYINGSMHYSVTPEVSKILTSAYVDSGYLNLYDVEADPIIYYFLNANNATPGSYPISLDTNFSTGSSHYLKEASCNGSVCNEIDLVDYSVVSPTNISVIAPPAENTCHATVASQVSLALNNVVNVYPVNPANYQGVRIFVGGKMSDNSTFLEGTDKVYGDYYNGVYTPLITNASTNYLTLSFRTYNDGAHPDLVLDPSQVVIQTSNTQYTVNVPRISIDNYRNAIITFYVARDGSTYYASNLRSYTDLSYPPYNTYNIYQQLNLDINLSPAANPQPSAIHTYNLGAKCNVAPSPITPTPTPTTVPNAAPYFNADPIISSYNGTVGSFYSYYLVPHVIDENPYTDIYSIVSGPSWLTLDGSSNGLMVSSSVPLSAVGLNTFVVKVTDEFGQFDTATFRVTVDDNQTPTPIPPTLTPVPPTLTPVPPTLTPVPPTPQPQVILNSGTNQNCNTRCNSIGLTCTSIGTDSLGINGKYYDRTSQGCQLLPLSGGIATCTQIMYSAGSNTCSGIVADWTRCKCVN
ncbi:hypothetical protein IPM62_05210 [Candidatus Woesebacteria bacterium]|nr:MAG: hypothetical protein IPM62_05210 [Candidatus Woesebacteria bacterium]